MKRRVFGLALMMAISFGHPVPFAYGQTEATPNTTGKAIPFKKEETGTGEAAGQTFAILVALLGLACAGLVAAKRYFPQLPFDLKLPLKTGANRRLQLIETMRLSPRTSLYLVQLDDRLLLLAQNGDTVTTIVNDHSAGSSARKL